MENIPDKSVALVVTSPPYFKIKDYQHDKQIGFHDTYEQYISKLNNVWKECHRVLMPGSRLCINVGDQYTRTKDFGRYKTIPIHADIIRGCEELGFDYMGQIIWQKISTTKTTGGCCFMGSYPYPRNGMVTYDFEYILLFKKLGKIKSIPKEIKEKSAMTKDQWRTYFSGHWKFPGVRQTEHIAMYPEELPRRLIRMYSLSAVPEKGFDGDVILDPFMGSGTTAKVAIEEGRQFVGFEINPEFKNIIDEKVALGQLEYRKKHAEEEFIHMDEAEVYA